MRSGQFTSQDAFEEYAEDYDRWFDEHLIELARIREILPPLDTVPSEEGRV